MTYQNILNKNVRSIDCKLLEDEYFDYMLYKGEVYGPENISEMTIADFSCPFSIKNGVLYSTSEWIDAKNNGVLLEDIGFTGPDNGFISFRKDRISNKDYLNILTGSTYKIEEGDTRLFLSPITGNTLNFDYPMSVDEDSTGCFISFKGGFYQGFYKLFGKEWCYQTLPNGPDTEWNLYFDIRPRSDYKIGVTTLNHIHPENKGIFFYLGTRAENKFWPFYKTDKTIINPLKRISDINNYTNAGICGEKSDADFEENYVISEDYMSDELNQENYFSDEYFTNNDLINASNNNQTFNVSDLYLYKYQEYSDCGCEQKNSGQTENNEDDCYYGPTAIEDEYMEKDAEINPDEIEDSFGHSITKKGYYEIESDNKFLMFDRTKDGFTTDNWVEGTTVTLTGRTDWPNINYFPVMDRTCTGYTVNDIYEYQEENSIPYNIYKDIKNNAFCLRITDDGAVGYRYSVLNCEADNSQHYTVEEEYSKPGIIKIDEWNKLIVKIVILNGANENKGRRKMKLYFYVNGFLVFISKELDEFNFRELNDVYQKQEGVPYNISLGGGTQGLLESILPDYYNTPEYIFPIEKDFCGTFLGDIKSFKIIDGSVAFYTIKNYLSENVLFITHNCNASFIEDIVTNEKRDFNNPTLPIVRPAKKRTVTTRRPKPIKITPE